MAIRVKQFNKQDIIDKENYTLSFNPPAKQIGVQSSLAGVKFKFNGDNGWISIGLTGIYELRQEDLIVINSIQFNSDELFQNANHIIVDILYEE